MFKKISKNTLRLLSIIMAFCMVFSTVAFAESAAVVTDESESEAVSEVTDEEDSSLETETEGDFIEIYSIQDLYNVRLDLTANYKLMNDIDLTEATASGGDWDFGGRGWNPIGSNDIYSKEAFSGIFDGNGYSIIGMRIDASSLPSGASSTYSYAGLFANVTGEVRNLDMKAVDIETNCRYSGAITAISSGNIVNCSVSGSISSGDVSYSYYVGGIAGTSSGVIRLCSNAATISANYTGMFGGIVGSNTGTIEYCYNTANIIAGLSVSSTAYVCVGGISGNQTGSAAIVSDSYNCGKVYAGNLSTSYNYAGGAVNHIRFEQSLLPPQHIGTTIREFKEAANENFQCAGC